MYSIPFIINILRIKAQSKVLERKSVKLNKHILVLESDDWGSLRMPSLATRERLINDGIHLCKPESYDLYDNIESNDDMLFLMEILDSVRDSRGKPAIMTLNCVMSNPDFNKIRDAEYKDYSYELFTDTYKRYEHRDKVLELWKEGIANQTFLPQLHGREHLNYQKWINLLQAAVPDVRRAFMDEVFSLAGDNYVLPALDAVTSDYYEGLHTSLTEAFNLFESVFGFKSESFIAPCYTWDDTIEKILSDLGVKYLQGHYFQTLTTVSKKEKNAVKKKNYLGEVNQYGQIYMTRNCQFEPSEEKKRNAEFCLNQIAHHFKAGRPAIVSCHRQNFIGINCPGNRDDNLKGLSTMLKTIVNEYPDVQFMSSVELGELLESKIL